MHSLAYLPFTFSAGVALSPRREYLTEIGSLFANSYDAHIEVLMKNVGTIHFFMFTSHIAYISRLKGGPHHSILLDQL